MSKPKHTPGRDDSTLPVRGAENPAATHMPGYVRASLRVLQGAPEDVGRVHVLKAPITILGRGEEADFSLADPRMSRSHATVTYHDRAREFRVADMKSENGTMLNGSRVTSYALRNNDRIVVGETLLVFEMDAGEQAADGGGGEGAAEG